MACSSKTFLLCAGMVSLLALYGCAEGGSSGSANETCDPATYPEMCVESIHVVCDATTHKVTYDYCTCNAAGTACDSASTDPEINNNANCSPDTYQPSCSDNVSLKCEFSEENQAYQVIAKWCENGCAPDSISCNPASVRQCDPATYKASCINDIFTTCSADGKFVTQNCTCNADGTACDNGTGPVDNSCNPAVYVKTCINGVLTYCDNNAVATKSCTCNAAGTDCESAPVPECDPDNYKPVCTNGTFTQCNSEGQYSTRSCTCNAAGDGCETVTPEPGKNTPPVESCGTLSVTGSDECSKTGSGSKIVLRGDVLGLDKTYEGGSVVIENGKITYVGCDPNMDGATVITCPNSVISPGTINAHEHITFSNGTPGSWGEERFDHRHDWRKGKNGHTKVPGPGTSNNMVIEVRAAMAGTTAIFGSVGNEAAGFKGLVRNLDSDSVGGVTSKYQTFPLGDNGGTMKESGCSYEYHNSVTKFNENCPYGPHIAEGINQAALNELRCLSGEGSGSKDIFKPNTAVIHGIAATPDMVAKMAANDVKLIWSPRTNISLYGDTAQVTMYDKMGVTIGLGTDWIYSGSANMHREFACIDYLNQYHYGKYFSDYDLWKMPTYNNAVALGIDKSVGQLKSGLLADIAVFRKTQTRTAHRAVIEADNGDVLLVMINGNMVFGNANLMSKGDAITVCDESKKFDLTANGAVASGVTFSGIKSAAKYDLFFCEGKSISKEPTCIPKRTRATDTTNQKTTMYTGVTTEGNDTDGDGIPDNEDNCPTIFNPIRPQDTDRKQADYDGDGMGDVCDPYPTCKANDDTCATLNPKDKDGDGIENATDNCPNDENADQKDSDKDGFGDACDKCPNEAGSDNGCPVKLTVPLSEIKDVRTKYIAGSLNGTVAVEGIVTGIEYTKKGFFVQDDAEPYGVYIYDQTAAESVVVGDLVQVEGSVKDFNSMLELTDVKVIKVGSGKSVSPVVVNISDIKDNKSTYNSVVVRVNGLTAQDDVDKYGVRSMKDGSGNVTYTDDFIMKTTEITNAVTAGKTYDLIGIIVYDYSKSKIASRSTSDIIAK